MTSMIGCASLLLVLLTAAMGAQAPVSRTSDALARMRVELSERRYAEVIAGANGILESARTLTTTDRIALWQLLAAAYYPETVEAQQADSAQLPLAALIRIVPDIKLERGLSWRGLDELAERTRAESFAAATRPLSEYTLSANSTGHITVVSSRSARFRLSSVDDAGSRTVVHDSSVFVTVAALRLRSHDVLGPVFTDGLHRLHIWAFDSLTGDSVHLEHRLRAARRDLPAPAVDSAANATPSASTAVANPPQPAAPVVPHTRASPRRTSMFWSGMALALATAAIAQEARPNDVLRSAFGVDSRAFIVGGVMASATVGNFFTRQARAKATTQPMAQRVQPVPSPRPASAPNVDRYRVLLLIDPPER